MCRFVITKYVDEQAVDAVLHSLSYWQIFVQPAIVIIGTHLNVTRRYQLEKS